MNGQRPIAIVTGGTKRVGLASAKALTHAGCDVVITFRGAAAEGESARAELVALGAAVRLERLELSDLAAVSEFGQRLAKDLPRLDVLVHNASSYEQTPLTELSDESLLTSYRTNAAAPALLSALLADRLRGSSRPGGGSIVAMCDMHVLGRPRRNLLAYSMAKAALVEMVRGLARELAPGARVNGVAPGVVAWPQQGPDANPDMQRAYLSRTPLTRAGTPEDAAEVVRWLALDAHYVTGEVVRVDGGRWLT